MSKKRDPNMPVGKMTRVEDFLPPPDKLIFPKQTIKITLNLRPSSVAFFKREAARHHTKYQQMIREVIDRYAGFYS